MNLPQVSIGIPVYNEAAHIAATLSSLAAQNWANTEFIIADNASTDGTAAICQAWAKQQPQARVIVAARNCGSSANFQTCLDAASGEYFMWAAGHDLWSPGMVSAAAALLSAEPEVVLAYPSVDWIDEHGERIRGPAPPLDTRLMDPLAALYTLIWADMHPIYGLIRTAALRSLGPIPNYAGADLVMLTQLALKGHFAGLPAELWSRRQTRAEEDYRARQQRYHSASFGFARGALDRLVPQLRLPWEVLRAVWKSHLPAGDCLAFSLGFLGMLPARRRVGRRRIV